MDLHKLRIFTTIARLGSFTRAAGQLHMTQPTVSQQLALLEEQIGVPLIERQTRRLRLTPAGEALLPYAERMLALAEEGRAAARSAAGLAERTLRLGVGHTLAIYLLPDLLRRYRAAHPDYKVRIAVGNSAELLNQVLADQIELALIGSPAAHPELSIARFMEDRLVVIIAPDDPWAGRTGVEPAELCTRLLLTREPGSALHATVERLLGATALASEQVMLLGETEAIKRSVEAGLGVALIQAIAVQREVQAGTLQVLALQGADDRRSYAYAHQARRDCSPAARALIGLLAN
jgi:DNA-binding transcriptional LysR family regulator